jgi:hypothetical protein
MQSLALLISVPAPNHEDHGEITKGVNQLGTNSIQVKTAMRVNGWVRSGLAATETGHGGWSTRPTVLGRCCAPHEKQRGEGKSYPAGLLSRFWPMANRKMRKGFLFFKSFLNSKPI